MTRLLNFWTALARSMTLISGIGLLTMVFVVVIDVIGRKYFPGFTIFGAIEIAVIAMIFLVYAALPWSFASNAHITVELATGALPTSINDRIDAFWLLVAAAITLFFAWRLWGAGTAQSDAGQVSELLRLSPLATYGAAAVGLLLTTCVAIASAVGKLRKPTGQDESIHTGT